MAAVDLGIKTMTPLADGRARDRGARAPGRGDGVRMLVNATDGPGDPGGVRAAAGGAA